MPRYEYRPRRNNNRQNTQPIPSNIPLTPVARRRMIISHNNDIIQVLLAHARSIRQMIYVVAGRGHVSNIVLSRRPSEPPAMHLVFGRRQILAIRGLFQPRDMVVVPHHVIDTTVGRLPVPNVSVVGVSIVSLEGGEFIAHSLTTNGNVELEAIFYIGVGPMFEPTDGPEVTPNTSNAIRYTDSLPI